MTDELKPCPFCGSDYQEMVIDRGGVSYIKCKECGARLHIDTTRCSDTLVPQLYEGLVRMWNRRSDGWDEVERIAYDLFDAKAESSEGMTVFVGVMDIDDAFRLLKRGCNIRRSAWTEGAWLIPITVPPGTIDGDYAMRYPSGVVEDYHLTVEDITGGDWMEVD